MRLLPMVLFCAICLSSARGLSAEPTAAGAAPIGLKLINVRMIWDEAPHNAFTDLCRFQDEFYVTFREAASHGFKEPCGDVRILRSADGGHWESAALLKYGTAAHDLRDAKLSVTPDGRLMVNSAVVPPEHRKRRQSLVWFSNDGENFEGPHEVGEPNWWLWCVEWHPSGTLYGISYGDITTHPRTTRLYRSRDGLRFDTVLPTLTSQAESGETALVFRRDGSAVALVRRDGKPPNGGLVGASAGDLRRWTFRDTGVRIGGPALIELPNGQLLAATRLYDGGARTSLSWLDAESGKLVELLRLPSGADTSYPGLLWHDDVLWVSYYSSHEGKSKIYLARVDVASR